jgi:small-conductance mechanosensitive channel
MKPDTAPPASSASASARAAGRRRMQRNNLIVLLLFLAVIGFILYVTFRSSPKITEIPWFPTFLAVWFDEHDEIRHLIGYGVLAALTFWVRFDFSDSRHRFLRKLRTSRYRTGRLGALFVMIYLLELTQLPLQHRDFDWMDIVNGWAGVLLAWLVWLVFKVRQRRRRRLERERTRAPEKPPDNIARVDFR